MKYFIVLLFVLTQTLLNGCASRSSTVSPVAVPSANYAGLSCEDTKVMLEQKIGDMNALTRKQNNAALADTVGVTLLLLPLGSIFGADLEGELAQAKGEVMALKGAVNQNCKRD